MNIWTCKRWEKYYSDNNVRMGIRLRIEKTVTFEVRRALKEFTVWMRKKYSFPIRIPVYVKSSERIKARDGDIVCATFFEPDDKYVEPYIKIATGDYFELERTDGRDNALAAILGSLIHELAHYYQWINCINLTEVGRERQANAYTGIILGECAKTREHP